MIKRFFSGFHLFAKAYKSTKHEIWVSVKLLAVLTVFFAAIMYVAEHSANEDYSFWDALVWTFVKYVSDPADIASSPDTVPGKVIGTLVGVLGIAIFAVPAGLIGSGLMDAMSEEKHEEELNEYQVRMRKAFRRLANKSLRGYLNTLPDRGGEKFVKLNFVPQFIPVSRLQVKQGMDLKDVFEVCKKYPKFRLKNLADAQCEEELPKDRFVVEHFPMNRSYGCFINRGSNVTIVCPTAQSDVGT